MIKSLPHCYYITLTDIINGCIKHSYFPNTWKQALIITFPKPGKNLSMPASYRPISLLPNLAKVFERVILTRLQSYSNIIPKEQHGFLPGRSTASQLVRILEYIGQGIHNHEASAILMLDVAKAFDRVFHTGLLVKLIANGLEADLIHLIKSYLDNRTFKVRVGTTMSTTRPIAAGVPKDQFSDLYSIFSTPPTSPIP